MHKEIELVNKAMRFSTVDKNHEAAILCLKEAVEINRLNPDTYIKLAIETTWVNQSIGYYLNNLSNVYYGFASVMNPENHELKIQFEKWKKQDREVIQAICKNLSAAVQDIVGIQNGTCSGSIPRQIECIYDKAYEAACWEFIFQNYAGIKFHYDRADKYDFPKKNFPRYLITRSCYEGVSILLESGQTNKARAHFDKAIALVKFDSTNHLIESSNWPTIEGQKIEILVCLYYIFVKRAAIHEQDAEYETAIEMCKRALACINHPLLGKKCELFYDPEPHFLRHRCEETLKTAAIKELERETTFANQAHQFYYSGDYQSCSSSCENINSHMKEWKTLYAVLCAYQLNELNNLFSTIHSLQISNSNTAIVAAVKLVQEAFRMYDNKSQKLHNLTEQFNNWAKKIHETTATDAIKLAICGRKASTETQGLDGICISGELNPKKAKKLSALIINLSHQKFFDTKDSIPQNFSDEHYEILVFQIAKAIRSFLALKGKSSKKIKLINSKISEKSLLADAIIAAIVIAKELIGNPILIKSGSLLEIETAEKEKAMALSNLFNALEQLHNTVINSAIGKIANIKSALSSAGSGPEFYERAKLKFQAGNYLEAISDYQMAIKHGSKSFYVYMELAEAYKNGLMENEALESYQIAIKLKPEQLKAYLEIANIYLNQKNWRLALEYYTHAYNLDVSCFRANQGLAQVYFEFNDYDRALTYCQATIQLQPNNPTLLKLRGQIYHRQKCLHEAMADYKEAIRLSPSLRAELTASISDIDAALAHTARLPSNNSDNSSVFVLADKNSEINSPSKTATSTFHQREIKKSELCDALIKIKQACFESSANKEEIEKNFKVLEPSAFELEYTEFFVERGDFYLNYYREISDQQMKNIIISNALADYLLALRFSPYYPGLQDKINGCQSLLKQPNPANVKATLFQPASSQSSAPTPSRAALTPEQLAKLEEIKAKMRQAAGQ